MFHKEPLTSEEPFLSLKNLWLNVSLWNQKWLFYGIAVKNLLSTFIFKCTLPESPHKICTLPNVVVKNYKILYFNTLSEV